MTDDSMRAAWLRGNEIGAASSGPIPAEASRLMAATATPDRAVIALDDFRMSKLDEALDDCDNNEQREAMSGGFLSGVLGHRGH